MLPTNQRHKSQSQQHEHRNVHESNRMVSEEFGSVLQEESLQFDGILVHTEHNKQDDEEHKTHDSSKYL